LRKKKDERGLFRGLRPHPRRKTNPPPSEKKWPRPSERRPHESVNKPNERTREWPPRLRVRPPDTALSLHSCVVFLSSVTRAAHGPTTEHAVPRLPTALALLGLTNPCVASEDGPFVRVRRPGLQQAKVTVVLERPEHRV